MAGSKENENQKWQKLEWEKKVTICNQGIANEDSLLLTWVIMFIALEAILFTILEFLKISRTAGVLLLPYILWVSFAAVLNISIWVLNP